MGPRAHKPTVLIATPPPSRGHHAVPENFFRNSGPGRNFYGKKIWVYSAAEMNPFIAEIVREKIGLVLCTPDIFDQPSQGGHLRLGAGLEKLCDIANIIGEDRGGIQLVMLNDRPELENCSAGMSAMEWRAVAGGRLQVLAVPRDEGNFAKKLHMADQQWRENMMAYLDTQERARRADDLEVGWPFLNHTARRVARSATPFDPAIEGYRPVDRQQAEACTLYKPSAHLIKLVPDDDWAVARTPDELDAATGVRLNEFMSWMTECSSSADNLPMHLVVGPGNGEILRAFGSRGHKMVGIGDALLFKPEELLDRGINQNAIQNTESDMNVWSKFHHLLGIALLSVIKGDNRNFSFGDLSSEKDFIFAIVALAHSDNPYIKGVLAGDMTLKTSGRFARQYKTELPAGVKPLLERFCRSPQDFFKRYYVDAFDPDGQVSLVGLIKAKNLQMKYGRFEDVLGLYEGVGKHCTSIQSVRATAHLSASFFAVFSNRIAALLNPGGGLVDDGLVASYTQQSRVHELMQVMGILGSDYQLHLIGDEHGPKSHLIFHADQNGEFPDLNDAPMGDGSVVVSPDKFAAQWPVEAVISAVSRQLEATLMAQINRSIANGHIPPERAFQGWYNHRFFMQIDDVLRPLVAEQRDSIPTDSPDALQAFAQNIKNTYVSEIGIQRALA